MTAFCLWIGYAVVACVALGVLAIVAEWTINRVVRALGVYKLVIQFFWERERKRNWLPYAHPELHPCEAGEAGLTAKCFSEVK